MLLSEEREYLKATLSLKSIETKSFNEGAYHILFKAKKKGRFGPTVVLRVQKEYHSLREAWDEINKLTRYHKAGVSIPLLDAALLENRRDGTYRVATLYPVAQGTLHEFLMDNLKGNAMHIGESFVTSIRNLAKVGLCGDIRPENALIYQGKCFFNDFDICYDVHSVRNETADLSARTYVMLAQMSASLTRQQKLYNANKLRVVFQVLDTAGVRLKEGLNGTRYPWNSLLPNGRLQGYLVIDPFGKFKRVHLKDPLPYLGKMNQ